MDVCIKKDYDRRPSSRMNMILVSRIEWHLEYHSFSSQVVEVRSSRWQLTILRARPTTEFGVILVPTIARHHDKIALCEEAVVLTIGMNKYSCKEKDEKISRSFYRFLFDYLRVCVFLLTSYEYIHAVRIRRVFVRCFASITARVVFVRVGDYKPVHFYDYKSSSI